MDPQLRAAAGGTRLGRTPPPTPLTPAAAVALWHQVLDPGPWRVLNTLIGIYPATVTRDELADHAGFSRTSGTFGGYISLLRKTALCRFSRAGSRPVPSYGWRKPLRRARKRGIARYLGRSG